MLAQKGHCNNVLLKSIVLKPLTMKETVNRAVQIDVIVGILVHRYLISTAGSDSGWVLWNLRLLLDRAMTSSKK